MDYRKEIEEKGFFIGLHTEVITKKELSFLTNNLLKLN